MDSIKEILLQIHKNQKKLRVKISVFLKKIEDILFKKREKLDASTQRLLLIGGDKDLFGLMQICGIKSKFKDSLKNSSFYCIKLLFRIFREHPQKKEFLQAFFDFDEDEFLTMRLGAHILSKKNDEDIGLEIARLIKEKRPHLNLKSYIQERSAQEKFEEWVKSQKTLLASKPAAQTKWQESDNASDAQKSAPTDANQTNMNMSMEFRSSNVRKREQKKAKRQKYFAEAHLQNFERTLEYYKLTFQDPLLSAFEEEEEEASMAKSTVLSSKKRQTSVTKNLLKSVFSKKLSNPEELAEFLKKNGSNIDPPMSLDEVVPKIHIESPDFDPVLFLTLFHTGTENKFLTEAAKQLGKQSTKGLSINKGLVYYYLDSFLDVHRGVMKSHLTFIEVETLGKGGSRLKQIEDSQKNLLLTVNTLSAELSKMKQDCTGIRHSLSFLLKNEIIIEMPSKLKKYYNRFDFERISKLFQQAFPYIKRYRNMSIFATIFNEIDRLLQMSQDVVISRIENGLKNKHQMNELTNILLDLQYDVQSDNKKPDQSALSNPSSSQFSTAASAVPTNNPLKQEEDHNLAKMIKVIQAKLLESIKINTNMSADESQQSSQLQPKQPNPTTDYDLTESAMKEARLKKMKLINSIQFDSDHLEQFKTQNNIADSQRQLKIKEIEAYLTENMACFENYYSLLQSYQEGEFDYKLPVKSNQIARKALQYFDKIFFALLAAVERCVAYIIDSYNFKAQSQNSQNQENSLSDLSMKVTRGKEDLVSCCKMLMLMKQLESRVKLAGKQLIVMQDKLLKIGSIIALFDLKLQLEGLDFYSGLEISKAFANDDQYSSQFNDYIYEAIYGSVAFLTSLKIFRFSDLSTLHQTFLLEAISLSFKTAFNQVVKTQSRIEKELNDLNSSLNTGNSSSNINSQQQQLNFSKDEVFLMILSNIQSFRLYQSKLLLQEIFESQAAKNTQQGGGNSATISQRSINDIINAQVKTIRDLMQNMVVDISGKLTQIKVQQILEKSLDLFTNQTSKEESKQSSTLSSQVKNENTDVFDSHSVYNVSIMQSLQPDASSSGGAGVSGQKYEIRYKLLDILCEIDQYIQLIVLLCGEQFLKDLPRALLEVLLVEIRKIIEGKQKNTTIVLLKQIRIELEFLQDVTVRIKSPLSQQNFSAIYSVMDKIINENFSGKEAQASIDKGKLKSVIRDTKYKFDLNFKFFM